MLRKKRVLILCDLFPPAFGPRMGYLTKYLSDCGWEAIVITEFVQDTLCFRNLVFSDSLKYVKYIKYLHFQHPFLRKIEWLFLFVIDIFFSYKDKVMFKFAQSLIKEFSVDVILCSTFRTFPFPAAIKLSKQYDLPIVVDFRDIVEEYPKYEFLSKKISRFNVINNFISSLLRRKHLRVRNSLLPLVDVVTTVSTWHVKMLKQYNLNVRLIYNGYDPEFFYPQNIRTDKFIIVYTGRILSQDMRDPSLFFDALSMLYNDHILSPSNCRVRWFIDDLSRQILDKLITDHSLLQFMDFFDYIPTTQVPLELNRSSVILLLANKMSSSGPKGMMTTKLFEALAVKKPILCVRSDEDAIEHLLHSLRAGLAARTVNQVYDFLKFHYEYWLANHVTKANVNSEDLDFFSRKRQACQFSDIFNSLCQS